MGGVDLGDAFAAEVDPRAQLEHRVLAGLASTPLPAAWSVDVVATQVVPGGVTRLGVSLRLAVPPAVTDVAVTEVDELAGVLAAALGGTPAPDLARVAESGQAGRCLRFPGQERLVGPLTVAEIVAVSAVDRVAGSGVAVADDDIVETGGFTRPCYEGGALVLRVGPGPGGRLLPLETAVRHTCCAGVH